MKWESVSYTITMRKYDRYKKYGAIALLLFLVLLVAADGRLTRQEIKNRTDSQKHASAETDSRLAKRRDLDATGEDAQDGGQKGSQGKEKKGSDREEGNGQQAAKQGDDEKKAEKELNMKVLLMTSGYGGYYHPQAVLRYDGGEHTYTPQSQELASGSCTIIPSDPEQGIQVVSIERTQGNPVYRGSIRIESRPEGLLLVNELPLEEYLYSVVPSEMPASYQQEALKAQAVCARTYAYRQILDNKLADYGAYVDDSVSFQVYNNISRSESSDTAVDQTRGEILTLEGEPIQAYYFSTSSGHTSTDEVWEAASPEPYLKSVACSYDSSEPWSQWSVTFSMDELTQLVHSHYGDIGGIRSLKVLSKGEGGAVLQLQINAEKSSPVAHNEYDIRALFAPKGKEITRKDGSTSQGGSLLPSAYFQLEPVCEGEVVTGYTFAGGGYGHGVGMSQNGANHMAAEGKGYQDILNYFFKSVTILDLDSL